jgi:hypothetical protein
MPSSASAVDGNGGRWGRTRAARGRTGGEGDEKKEKASRDRAAAGAPRDHPRAGAPIPRARWLKIIFRHARREFVSDMRVSNARSFHRRTISIDISFPPQCRHDRARRSRAAAIAPRAPSN